ncbi:DUF726 domain-containing protein [Haloarchaeobius sp. DYHT-AS-18]|uniref:DUF726 domain-containing protein n=1 Tax=Haloarchaeobius sp. DYHT-AS-18 TaxID=3446117 RepID=UPI003EB99767
MTSDKDGLSRRSALKGLATTGLALGGLSGIAAAGGSDGDYQAPADYPLISTRGHFDDDGNLTSSGTTYNYYGEGDWAKYTESWHDEIIVFVHGWNQDDSEDQDIDGAYTCELALEQNGVSQTNVGYSWDSDRGWWTAVDIAKRNGPKLANWIANWNNNGGDPIRLIGHSLGAQVVASTLANLHAWGYYNAVETASLVGGAIPDQTVSTEDKYGDAIEYSSYSFGNFYNREDDVLDWAYSTAEWDTAVGEQGIQDGLAAPYNYQELDVTQQVPDHGSYYEPGDGCIPEVVASW